MREELREALAASQAGPTLATWPNPDSFNGAVRVAVLCPLNFSNPWGVRSLATNGHAVVASGDDGFVRVWAVDPPAEAEPVLSSHELSSSSAAVGARS